MYMKVVCIINALPGGSYFNNDLQLVLITNMLKNGCQILAHIYVSWILELKQNLKPRKTIKNSSRVGPEN